MQNYFVKRIGQMGINFLVITMVVFILMRLAPGEPLQAQNTQPSFIYAPDLIDTWKSMQGLDQPIWIQYLRWFSRVLSFDFGRSMVDGRSVKEILGEALPRTLGLTLGAIVLIYGFAIPLGILSALRRQQRLDKAIQTFLLALYAIPNFWLGLLLLVLFAGGEFFQIFPLRGLHSENISNASWFFRYLDSAWHLVLPIFCLAYPAWARISRLQRHALVEVMHQDFIRTARAKGLLERQVLWRHAFRNALVPIITMLSLNLPTLMGGSVLIEKIFTIRGLGLVGWEAVLRRDYPVLMGITVLMAIVTVGGMLLGDLLHAWLDPRIRNRRQGVQ